MIKRYKDPRIAKEWSEKRKFALWQEVELAVIEARHLLYRIPAKVPGTMRAILKKHPISIKKIEELDAELSHDLNAFLGERMRFLPCWLQRHFHKDMTSYDTEETAFIIRLKNSCVWVLKDARELSWHINDLGIRYMFMAMNARTHGQEAEMQSFGKRCLTWYKDVRTAIDALSKTTDNLEYSKLSGAIGTNSGIDPELERVALETLGFEPWNGATQIMPRVLYSPIADALANLTLAIDKTAIDLRLGARSGRPLWHEPFGKKQKGSSAMPHKKNTIGDENTAGMATMAKSYATGIKENILTWEERDIAQSSVERVFWPDLFDVTLRAIKNTSKIISGLVVYPDNMLIEIRESRGTYASNEAKELLTEIGSKFGIDRDTAYRIVQLAAFNAFEPNAHSLKLRANPPKSLEEMDEALEDADLLGYRGSAKDSNIRDLIAGGKLRATDQLEASPRTVKLWNKKLHRAFRSSPGKKRREWEEIFRPSHILANEKHLFAKVFGV